MLAWLRRKFRLVVVWFKPEPPALPVPVIESPPIIVPTEAPPIVAEPPAVAPHQQHNRSIRRQMHALERARRKRDKFVEPQGTPPVPKPRIERPKAAEPNAPAESKPSPEIDDGEQMYFDKHHEGGDEDVAYKAAELYGEYNFRDTILEQLERYFVYLKRMKKNSPDDFALYSELGAILVPYIAVHSDWATKSEFPERARTKMPKLSPWFKTHRPTFGCVVFGANPLAERHELTDKKPYAKNGGLMVPKFMYFSKYKQPPPEVQRRNGGDTYSLTVWWDRPHDPESKRKHGTPTEYAVFVSKDGDELDILKQCETKMIRTLAKKHKKKKLYFHIPQRCWQIPKFYKEWADDHNENVRVHLGHLFNHAMESYEEAHYSMIRVAVKKDDMTAVFSVNVRRMAYFFKDRDYVLNEHGARKPVFHMVRAHPRNTKTGEHSVRFHFRGEKNFSWAGYAVSVTVPGRDHFMLQDIDIGFSNEFWLSKKERKTFAHMPEIAKRIADGIKSGKGAYGP